MKLENQVCSLELSKQLKELGIKQESLVYWLNIQHCVHMKVKEDGYSLQEDENGQPIIDKIDYRIELGNPYAWNIDKDNCWSAFTVAELGEMLPRFIEIERDCYSDEEKYLWRIKSCEHETFSENEANARAEMLVYLLENKLMELPNE